MEVLTKVSVDSFLDQVADRTPTPGGGSVTGLTGALACALARMVIAYSVGEESNQSPTLGKGGAPCGEGKRDARNAGRFAQAKACGSGREVDIQQTWTSHLHRADELIRALITQDATAHTDMARRRNEATAAGEHSAAQAAYADAVLAAMAVPMEMAAVASNVLAAIDEFKTAANRYLLSDLAIAAILADATARAARYTLRISARELSDVPTRTKVLTNIDRIVERCARHLESVEGFIRCCAENPLSARGRTEKGFSVQQESDPSDSR